MKKLDVGEKFLSISIDANMLLGLATRAMIDKRKTVNFSVFKNKDKKDDGHPDFRNLEARAAVWISTKKNNDEKLISESETEKILGWLRYGIGKNNLWCLR